MSASRSVFLGTLLASSFVFCIATSRAWAEPDSPEPPVTVVAPPPPEPAPPDPAPPPPPDPPPRHSKYETGPLYNGVEFSVGTLLFQPDLSNVVFSGSGTPLSGAAPVAFSHRGREIGAISPLLFGGDISLLWMRRYFAAGIWGFVAGNTSSADPLASPSDTAAANLVDPHAMVAYGGGVELEGAIPIDDHTALRIGPTFGLREYSIPLTGFRARSCSSKGHSYPCYEQASSDVQPFAQPRIRFELSPYKKVLSIFVGLYAGYDALGDGGFTGGLTVGVHTPHPTLLP